VLWVGPVLQRTRVGHRKQELAIDARVVASFCLPYATGSIRAHCAKRSMTASMTFFPCPALFLESRRTFA
jgi:hypothetical protein